MVDNKIQQANEYYQNGDWEKGIKLVTEMIYEAPEDMALRHSLARFFMEDGQFDLAIDQLEMVLDAQPENYDAYYDLGRVHFELGNYDCAIENFENVLEFKNENEWIYYWLAQAYEANNEVDKALSNYLKAIMYNEGFHQAYKKAAVLFLARGDYEDAAECFEDYMSMDVPEEEKDKIQALIERIKLKVM